MANIFIQMISRCFNGGFDQSISGLSPSSANQNHIAEDECQVSLDSCHIGEISNIYIFQNHAFNLSKAKKPYL